MNSQRAVTNWHRNIINDCEQSLGRRLTQAEHLFIFSRGGFIALEIIHDTVKALASNQIELASYLNSEAETSTAPSD